MKLLETTLTLAIVEDRVDSRYRASNVDASLLYGDGHDIDEDDESLSHASEDDFVPSSLLQRHLQALMKVENDDSDDFSFSNDSVSVMKKRCEEPQRRSSCQSYQDMWDEWEEFPEEEDEFVALNDVHEESYCIPT